MPEPEIVSCGFLLFRKEPSCYFLLMQHRDRWDLPKGHVDPGESNRTCALRELFEETGIRAEQIQIDEAFEFQHDYLVTLPRYGKDPKRKRLIVYLAYLLDEVEIVATEHLGFRWFDWAPPHQIQPQTIDPLLAAVASHWQTNN
ncbi:MAG: NUDIX domain-containing protein [Pirellulaceae bacterium]